MKEQPEEPTMRPHVGQHVGRDLCPLLTVGQSCRVQSGEQRGARSRLMGAFGCSFLQVDWDWAWDQDQVGTEKGEVGGPGCSILKAALATFPDV